jgi:glycosyltransferase involved in cell wall biosynthesis
MKNKKDKVLFIRRPGAFGGIEVLLLDWMKHVDYRKNEVVLASTKDYFSDNIQENRFPVEYKTLSLPVLGSSLSIYRSWAGDIKRISPDKIVIMQGTIDEIPLPCVLAAYKATRGNVYMTEHLAAPLPPKRTRSLHYGFLPGVGLWWYKKMLTLRLRGYLVKRILAVSEGVKNVLLMYGYPSEKISIAYHGVDVSQFSPSGSKRKNWRQRHDIPEQDLVFVSTARLAQEKRIERIIKAFDTLSQEYDNLWLLIAGDGPMRKELEIAKNSLGCRDRIKLLGLVENVSELLQASDIFVLPSDREGLSVSLTEAMSTGLICIASDVSGSNEVIQDGENGFLVEPSDQGVFHGMETVLKMNDSDRKIIAQNARNSIVEHFEMRKSVTNILGLLDIESI